MRGQTVIVRDFQGKPLVRKVWELANSRVYICSEDTYHRLLQGEQGRNPVGFLAKDVFGYDEVVLKNWQNGKLDSQSMWKRLTVLKEDDGNGKAHQEEK